MMGRMMLYGTAGGGMAGASQTIGILRHELDVAMAPSGCKHISELDRRPVEMPHHSDSKLSSLLPAGSAPTPVWSNRPRAVS
ncbi:alpha-hydroxy-acid oxidizing protein [Bradyrhizobium sp. CCBAU 11434]|uniref:alpha-hydroxy-acid oxidizing protein n=1 Tax=Bradyrhizobium sp. CCBAU 11434 TaxID=1630885 RepID=UPI003FA44DD4